LAAIQEDAGGLRAFYSAGLAAADPAYATVARETGRQRTAIELIASENIASHGEADNAPVEARVKQVATELCARFPICT
jgi:hypothetical protein